MKVARVVLIIGFLVSLSGFAAGQGAHYTYPFSLECPDRVVSPGETVSVSADFEGGDTGERYSPTYNWSTSGGTIMSGQGTREISLTLGEEISNVQVTLNRTFVEAHFPGVQRDAACTIAVVQRPVARMTDEFRTRGNNCEEGFARLDNFFIDLNNDPAADGVIVLYGDLRAAGAASHRELQLRNHFTFRGFPLERVEFVRGPAREDGTTQFWIVPPGANGPEVDQTLPPVEKPPTEPYLYAAQYVDGVPGCSGNLFDVTKYAGVLRSLPGSRGRIVISEASRAKYNRRLREILSELRNNGVAGSRITALYKYVKPNRALESAELWVIPARSRPRQGP